MSNPIGDPGHGHSPAAWTAVIIMLVGVTVGTVALFFNLFWLVGGAAGIVLIGAIVGWILGKAGYGANGPKFVAKEH